MACCNCAGPSAMGYQIVTFVYIPQSSNREGAAASVKVANLPWLPLRSLTAHFLRM